jgi:hypothetical protein
MEENIFVPTVEGSGASQLITSLLKKCVKRCRKVIEYICRTEEGETVDKRIAVCCLRYCYPVLRIRDISVRCL